MIDSLITCLLKCKTLGYNLECFTALGVLYGTFPFTMLSKGVMLLLSISFLNNLNGNGHFYHLTAECRT